MTTLIVFLVRVAIFLVLTFSFVVLYQYGPNGFLAGAPVEWERIANLGSLLTKKPVEMPPSNPPDAAPVEQTPTN